MLLLACALLAAGCANDSSDESKGDYPNKHRGGRGRAQAGQYEGFTPSPTPGAF